MQPLRALWELYYSVHWNPLIKIQDVTLNILGPTHHFGWFSRWPPRQTTKYLYQDGRQGKRQNTYMV